MTAGLAGAFSLARLAEQAGMSEFHSSRLFKRAAGVLPSQYLIRLRMDAARRLLRETQEGVITIANEVGYSPPVTLSNSSARKPVSLPLVIGGRASRRVVVARAGLYVFPRAGQAPWCGSISLAADRSGILKTHGSSVVHLARPLAGRAGPGGADRVRTDDLLVANEALFQLSYDPGTRKGGD